MVKCNLCNSIINGTKGGYLHIDEKYICSRCIRNRKDEAFKLIDKYLSKRE